jgi:replicative DNA helicase
VTAEDVRDAPPHDIQAERITLGSMMLSAAVLAEVQTIISPADHYRPAHQIVHEAILRLDERGEPTDAEAVRLELTRTGELARTGGPQELLGLIGCVPTAANGPYYARIVRERAILRRVVEAGTRIVQMGQSADPDVEEVIAQAEAALREAAGEGPGSTTAAWLADAVFDVIGELGQPLPVSQVTPPYADLRKIVPSLRAGQLVTIAARPSIGKTLVAGDFARRAALELGLPVAWFTLEMSREEIIIRCISAQARVNHEHLQLHRLDDDEWRRVRDAVKVFGESRLLIDEKGGANLAHVRSALRSMRRTAPPALVVFDYLQLGSSPGAPSRQEEVSRLARGFKDIAMEFGVPVLQTAQLNRNPESRQDKRPLQADLRESGEIENSSDVVILLHREDYYEPECPRAGQMDLIVTKNRNGRTGQCTVTFQGRFCRCQDLAPEESAPQGAYWGSDS